MEEFNRTHFNQLDVWQWETTGDSLLYIKQMKTLALSLATQRKFNKDSTLVGVLKPMVYLPMKDVNQGTSLKRKQL